MIHRLGLPSLPPQTPLVSLLMGLARTHHSERSFFSSHPSKEQPLGSSCRQRATGPCASSQKHQQLCRLCCWASLPAPPQALCPQSPPQAPPLHLI